MQRLIGAAFQTPSQAGSAQDGSGFAILPRQSQEALVISRVHTRLDRVLRFLQREIGYVLLDDSRPGAGGSVQIQRHPGASSTAPSGGRRSVRIPQGPREARTPKRGEIDKDRPRESITFSTATVKYAHFADDLVLVWRFANTLAEDYPGAEQAERRELLYKTVLQGMRLMHLCSYHYSDLVVTLAYASIYFKSICADLGDQMSDIEASHVCALLIFLAHSFVLDESCPLKYWQRYIFRDYCTLKVLDAALFRIFEMQDFRLRVSPEAERHALSALLRSGGTDVVLSVNDGPHSFAAETAGMLQTEASGGG